MFRQLWVSHGGGEVFFFTHIFKLMLVIPTGLLCTLFAPSRDSQARTVLAKKNATK